MGDLDFSGLFDSLLEELDDMSVNKPTVRIPADRQSAAKEHDPLNGFAGALRAFRQKFFPTNKEKYSEVFVSMPVMNPKTGEMDHVDLSLVSKIIIEPEYLYDFETNDKKKVELSLEGQSDKSVVVFSATFPGDVKESHSFTAETFESIMSRVVHSDNQQRLEQTPEFSGATDVLIRRFILDQKVANRLYVRIDETVELVEGVGIVHDIKAKQDIGTFETLVLAVKKNNNETHFDALNILSSVRTRDDITGDPTRYQFSYYNLAGNVVYQFVVLEDGKVPEALDTVREQSGDQSIRFHRVKMDIFSMSAESDKIPLIQKANETKNALRSVSPDDFLYSQFVEQFNAARFSILKASEEKAKKAQMLNKYADMELF
jgi:hypothetical protein